ncbi:MAG: sigma-70 family RNA polymerase sigma factor [Phycisphaerales bacterium]|nr:MAG: sigma-70 family RNA polymerase sigma factor [Phycisphaerales bacterium]
MPTSSDTTRLLLDLRKGDGSARDELLTLVYDELRDLAARHMAKERPDHTLQPTALAHEAYMRLVDDADMDWQSHAHFLGVASEVIRRILIDHARKHDAAKRGGAIKKVRLSDAISDPGGVDIEILALDQALQELAALNERHHQVVVLRFFGGLTIRQTALVMGVAPNTVNADWQTARAWLRQRLLDSPNS